MEKQEFLDKMRLALSGKVPSDTVTETIRYYEEYINTQLRLGKSSEEVMETLGDPRLIAKTIIETSPKQKNSGTGRNMGNQNEEANHTTALTWKDKALEIIKMIPGWAWLVIFFVLIVIVIGVVFKILIAIAPVLIIAGVAYYIIKFLRGGDADK